MPKKICIIYGALLISGCASSPSLNKIGDFACNNREATELALAVAEEKALLIRDPEKQYAALAAIDATRFALSTCPKKNPAPT